MPQKYLMRIAFSLAVLSSGLVFGLTSTQAAQLNALIAANPGAILTVGATFASAQGGNDAIQAVRLVAVPEPTSMLQLGTGLVGVATAARRRLKAPK